MKNKFPTKKHTKTPLKHKTRHCEIHAFRMFFWSNEGKKEMNFRIFPYPFPYPFPSLAYTYICMRLPTELHGAKIGVHGAKNLFHHYLMYTRDNTSSLSCDLENTSTLFSLVLKLANVTRAGWVRKFHFGCSARR